MTCWVVRMNLSSTVNDACAAGTAGADGPDRITRYGYDTANRRLSTTVALGTSDERTETIAYDPGGLQRTVSDGKTNLTTYVLDGFGRTQSVKFPSPTTPGSSSSTDFIQYGYDPTSDAARITSVRRRDSSTDSPTLDDLGRTTARTSPATSLIYDNLGRLTSISQGGLTFTRAYDPQGRIKSETGPLGAVSYAYDTDVDGKPRQRTTWPDGNFVDHVGDFAGGLLEVRENGLSSGAQRLARFDYDALNRRQTLTDGNNVVTGYGYDAVSRLQSLNLDIAGVADDVQTTFVYNASGQIRSKTSTNPEYNWNGFVSGTRGYQVNGLNQLTNAGDNYVKYNAQGHLRSVCATSSETQCANVYGYDPEGKLTSSALVSGSGSGTTSSASMIYDPFGRLYQMTDTNQVVTRFQYDGDQLIAEYGGSGALLRRYVHGQGADEPLVWYEGASLSDRRWMSADERGSVVAVTDSVGNLKLSTSGTKMVLTYDDYGAPDGANGGVRFQYTGQAWLPEVALYHYKARAYSPYLGRFLQTDPIGYGDGLNWYAYVGDDPVNSIDPTGLGVCGWTICEAVETIITAGSRGFSGGGFVGGGGGVSGYGLEYAEAPDGGGGGGGGGSGVQGKSQNGQRNPLCTAISKMPKGYGVYYGAQVTTVPGAGFSDAIQTTYVSNGQGGVTMTTTEQAFIGNGTSIFAGGTAGVIVPNMNVASSAIPFRLGSLIPKGGLKAALGLGGDLGSNNIGVSFGVGYAAGILGLNNSKNSASRVLSSGEC
jgi:RHS repeat-associated protein